MVKAPHITMIVLQASDKYLIVLLKMTEVLEKHTSISNVVVLTRTTWLLQPTHRRPNTAVIQVIRALLDIVIFFGALISQA